MSKATAVRVHSVGGPEMLRVEERDVGSPGPQQVLVRQTVIGVNFIDIYHRTGLYPLPQLPHGIGVEAAGVIEAVGCDVTEMRLGDRVAYAMGSPGAYATLRILDAAQLVLLPEDIDDKTAAGMMLRGMTAEYLIHRTYKVQPGQTVLLHAAAGGVGLIVSQWLRELGAVVIGTVSSDEKAKLAESHGCAHTIVYTREDFVKRVREITHQKGVSVVYDSVGKITFRGSLDCLSPRGLLVSYGNASGKPDPFDVVELSAKGSLYITRPTLATYVATREELLASAKSLFDVVQKGVVRIRIGNAFPFMKAAEAHRALESRHTTGSVVLVP